MIRLLLDLHLSPAVARNLHSFGIDVQSAVAWRGGFAGKPDSELLVAAVSDERTLVTYDQPTIPTLLIEWAEADRHHVGVVFVDDKTFRQDDVGGLIRALRALVERSDADSWSDRILYLRPA